MTMLGAMQVSAYGDLTNRMFPGKTKGFGGAMELVSIPEKRRDVALTEPCGKRSDQKILKLCMFR